MDDTFDCLACGRCCRGQKNYVRVFADDVIRLGPEKTERLVAVAVGQSKGSIGHPPEAERYMKMTDGHCAALEISHEKGTYACGVYEDRPLLCRVFEVGSQACLEARAVPFAPPAAP